MPKHTPRKMARDKAISDKIKKLKGEGDSQEQAVAKSIAMKGNGNKSKKPAKKKKSFMDFIKK